MKTLNIYSIQMSTYNQESSICKIKRNKSDLWVTAEYLNLAGWSVSLTCRSKNMH